MMSERLDYGDVSVVKAGSGGSSSDLLMAAWRRDSFSRKLVSAARAVSRRSRSAWTKRV